MIVKWIILKGTSFEIFEQRNWTASVAEQTAHILTIRYLLLFWLHIMSMFWSYVAQY